MTGLDPDKEEIIEICCIITNGQLDIIDLEGYHTLVHQPKSRMDQMDEWCTRTHGKSGLTAAVIESKTTAEQAADGLYEYICKYIPEERTALLAGNSVHADRMFLRKEPYTKITDHLHYRILDVSSIKEAARRWSHPSVAKRTPTKHGTHKARDDILESIEEARYFQQVLFAPKDTGKKQT